MVWEFMNHQSKISGVLSICYGGPYRCFSNANVAVKGRVNYISEYFADDVSLNKPMIVLILTWRLE